MKWRDKHTVNISGAEWRKTTQNLLPTDRVEVDETAYRMYPVHPAKDIRSGFASLADHIRRHKIVLIDGYVGVFWDDFKRRLTAALQEEHHVRVTWLNVADLMLPEDVIHDRVAPFLGGSDPLFGKRCTLSLQDLFDAERLAAAHPNDQAEITIAYGCGAALLNWQDAFLIYVDLPKNEIQYRARAQTAWNLGQRSTTSPKAAYKRYYFVDWVLLNRHKAALTPSIDLMVDHQHPDNPTMMTGADFRAAMDRLSQSVFRVRPWFEPGAWGGHWLRKHIPGLPQDVPNYAWSFEMIAPEQGIIFGDDEHLLEVSFDFLMVHNARAILGDYVQNFGYEFPIRFDYLDTIRGGNLSIQCHPSPGYIREQFGEHFTQDETYYILDCEPGATVYLGFQADINPQDFRQALEHSHQHNTEINITDFVQQFPANKHDLFLIPNGTIHASGSGNMVLEISATPYIFTFKMYDWLRLDLDGKPRPININRAFANLRFDRKGETVSAELLSKPQIIVDGDDYRREHLPTHPTHFYDIERFDVFTSVEVSTEGSVQVLMVVEGKSINVEVNGVQVRYHYAETFIIPAAAQTYRLVNTEDTSVRVVRAFLKASWFQKAENQWLSLR